MLKQAGKEEKKQPQHTAANFTKKSAAKEAKKSLKKEVLNSIVKLVAKADPNELNNTKDQPKQKAKQA